jgi:carbonic anhydrase
MPDDLLGRLKRFRRSTFPRYRREFRDLAERGQHPSTLFIGCSDSRLVPHLLTDSGPGELFVVRNVGNFVPPWDASYGYHGTCAAIEFALLNLRVRDIVVCGHSHCGAVRALYEDAPQGAPHLAQWLELGREACLPVQSTPEALRRTEQRSIALQLERLMQYPLVAAGVERGEVFLHGWHYSIENGDVAVLDLAEGAFVSAGRGSGRDESAPPPLDLLQ